jgi:hypothetical protein
MTENRDKSPKADHKPVVAFDHMTVRHLTASIESRARGINGPVLHHATTSHLRATLEQRSLTTGHLSQTLQAKPQQPQSPATDQRSQPTQPNRDNKT